MAITGNDLATIQAIESAISDLQKAVKNLASKAQMRQLLLIKQEEINTLSDRVTALETAVSSLERSLK